MAYFFGYHLQKNMDLLLSALLKSWNIFFTVISNFYFICYNKKTVTFRTIDSNEF